MRKSWPNNIYCLWCNDFLFLKQISTILWGVHIYFPTTRFSLVHIILKFFWHAAHGKCSFSFIVIMLEKFYDLSFTITSDKLIPNQTHYKLLIDSNRVGSYNLCKSRMCSKFLICVVSVQDIYIIIYFIKFALNHMATMHAVKIYRMQQNIKPQNWGIFIVILSSKYCGIFSVSHTLND